MKGRLSFGLSMAFEFDVYLIDELTSVGDTNFREKAKAAFESIRKRASLIFVSHNIKTLRQSCQSALFMRDGMADFYPDIDEGIEAYNEYVRAHRNHENPKEGAGNSEKRGKKSKRRKARRARKNLENPPEEGNLPPN
jgi:capsular polysaccharide transport system ATP-binding protein